MLRSVAFITISFLLILSILGPPVASMICNTKHEVIAIESGDEEKKSKEVEKKFEAETFFIDSFCSTANFLRTYTQKEKPLYIPSISNFTLDINLPPPEKMA
ncbi:MAG: hypothetical protein AAGB24_00595 [Bacteroidota bacterium]